MLKNILDNVLSSGSNGSDDKIKELLNSIIGSNQVPSFVGDILNKALEQLNQGQGAGLVSPMINKALESYSKDNALTPDMNELFKLTSNNGISDIAGNIINTLIKNSYIVEQPLIIFSTINQHSKFLSKYNNFAQ